MKKILLAANCIFIAVIIFQACCTKQLTGGNGGYTMGESSCFSSCYNCFVDDLHGEPANEFVEVVARYKTTHQELFNQFAKGMLNTSAYPNTGIQVDPDFEDARSCWFSVDTLDKFICLMKRYGQAVGIDASKMGIRFYHAVYPNGNPYDPGLSNMTTLYLAATQDNNNTGYQQDFDPRASYLAKLASPTNADTIVTLASQIEISAPNMFVYRGGRTARFMSGATTDPNIVMNQGDLCPPGTACNTTLEAVRTKNPNQPLSNPGQ